ncbi:RNA polymerase subunit sigma [Desulfotomaculum copahuensis]|uniref:RNA polymerase subunit sigma n=1 Tax=Desulfotomaculum copahuensis TaxID=1838280 RepID=A0A1B7LBT9_9FIRM|nr:RNA polymerase subunit sigma [Desulfotomaculum copahuensis]
MFPLSPAGGGALPAGRFKELFDSHYPAVYRRAACILGNPAAAEDVAQETFLKLYQAPPVNQENLAGWLARVATNLAYNHLRGENNRRRRESAQGIEEATMLPSCEEEALRREETRLVQQVLDHLPERDRTCLLLRFSGAGYREIAALIDVKPGSVGTLLARAQARFREEYARLSGRDG